jgi:tryptophan-rich sensory protein
MQAFSMQDAPGLAGFLALCFSVAWFGARFRPGQWYRQLVKPAWTPPDRIFAPVWIVLYMMMAVAGWMVWRTEGSSIALAVFAAQLLLNGIWSWLFFGLHRPDLALVDIVALWIAIAATVATFSSVSTAAAALLLPYLAWVSFALLLNFSIWRLNRS